MEEKYHSDIDNSEIDIPETGGNGEGGTETNPPETPIEPTEPIELEKPVLVSKSETYTGEEITFEIENWDNLSLYLELTEDSDSLTQTEIGKYSITLKFKDDSNATWVDGTTDEIMLSFEITEPKSDIDIVNQFREKYNYLSLTEAEDIYYQAYNTYLDLAFPFNYDITEIPEDRPRAIYWVKDCMKEIIDRNGITATSYSENGLSYTWSTDMVSDILRARVIPLAVVRGSKK